MPSSASLINLFPLASQLGHVRDIYDHAPHHLGHPHHEPGDAMEDGMLVLPFVVSRVQHVNFKCCQFLSRPKIRPHMYTCAVYESDILAKGKLR